MTEDITHPKLWYGVFHVCEGEDPKAGPLVNVHMQLSRDAWGLLLQHFAGDPDEYGAEEDPARAMHEATNDALRAIIERAVDEAINGHLDRLEAFEEEAAEA